MYNDFKILIMLIENFKNSFKLNKLNLKNKITDSENENILDGKLSLQSKMNSINESEEFDGNPERSNSAKRRSALQFQTRCSWS